MYVLLVLCDRLDGGGDCQHQGCFKYEIDVQVESQNLAMNEAKLKKKNLLGKGNEWLWGERRDCFILLFWHIIYIGNLVLKLFMFRASYCDRIRFSRCFF